MYVSLVGFDYITKGFLLFFYLTVISSLSKSGSVKAPKTLELTVLNGKNEKVHYTERNVKH